MSEYLVRLGLLDVVLCLNDTVGGASQYMDQYEKVARAHHESEHTELEF